MKQISVTLPTDLRPAVQELAKRTRAGESAESVLRDIFPALPPVETPPAQAVPAAPLTPGVTTTISFESRFERLLSSLPAHQ